MREHFVTYGLGYVMLLGAVLVALPELKRRPK
jgi:hypothetical protein